MGELGFTRVWGKQFRYIYPINKSSKEIFKKLYDGMDKRLSKR